MQLRNPFQAFLILCLQKIIPIFLLSLLMREILITFIISSALLGGILGFNQNSLIKILAYSSIVHSGWIISGLTINLTSSYFYYIIYTVTRYVFITIISSRAIKNVSEIINMNNSPLFIFSLIFTIFTLSGTPPFIGFFRKIYVLLDLISLKFYTVSLTLIVGSTLSFYFYLRLIARISLVRKLTLKDKSNKINLFNTSSLIIIVNLRLLVVI
jgi:NADH-quinone oxidoreductase subunit N